MKYFLRSDTARLVPRAVIVFTGIRILFKFRLKMVIGHRPDPALM